MGQWKGGRGRGELEGLGPEDGGGKRESCRDSLNGVEMGLKWEGERGMAKAWRAGCSKGVREDERKHDPGRVTASSDVWVVEASLWSDSAICGGW